MFWSRLTAIVLALIFIVISSESGFAAEKGGEILVSAAFSLKEALEEISALYERQTGIVVRRNFGASGLLQKQIETGAPADVFASAGEKQMDALQSQGLIVTETRRDFAGNTLVMIVPSQSKITIKSFLDLARREVERVAIGNPKTVPAGQYAEEALKNLKLLESVRPRFILAENVRQVLDYVTRGEADAGMVYASDLAGMESKVAIAARAPERSHSPIQYPIAVVKQSEKKQNAQRFIDMVLSGAGQAVLKKYGFLGPR
jgi:molybdate transport system substrate-binding protein